MFIIEEEAMKATNVCDVWNGVKGGGGGGWGMEAALKVAFFFLLPCVCVCGKGKGLVGRMERKRWVARGKWTCAVEGQSRT